jgi:sulfur carrier protein ThiS
MLSERKPSSMKIKVKLFGTLGLRVPHYDAEQGLAVEITRGTRVSDLLVRLNLSDHQGGFVVQEGRFLSSDEELTDGAVVQIFQAMYGG